MLTITATTKERGGRAVWVVCGVAVAVAIVLVALRVRTWENPSFLALLPLIGGIAPGLHLYLTRPRSITISEDGIRWRGPGWERHTRWDDVGDVGVLAPVQGVGGTWVAARLRPDAPPPSPFLLPRRLRRLRVDPERDLAGLVLLTHTWVRWPDWDVPQDVVLAALRSAVGERWCGDLTAAEER